ncbi:cache domain-containing protein [Terrabacter sp. NPDC080008]|uniref:cache domain-containing protein n=1 Tax=Terrabacter sp. NPDC080008 TaxID=3155176 RepID=UPI0034504220
MKTTKDAEDVAQWVSGFGRWAFDQLDDIAVLLEAPLSLTSPRRADLCIEQRCHELLADPQTPVAGAGAVFAPGVLSDAPYWLEWWTVESREGAHAVTKLAAETDPRAVGFRDYTELPWYAKPFETGSRHVTGPYVDYLCTDQYTLTFTCPLFVAGSFAGVVGVDVLVAWLEERLLDVMATVDRTCVLVNAAGRVVTSSDPTWVTGDLIRDLPIEAWLEAKALDHPDWSAARCEGLPFVVLTPR